jgi:transcriptional regulator with PAS, ATPase and Fis domain
MSPASSRGGLSFQQIQTVLDLVSDAVVTVDREYVITSFNRVAEQATGIERSRAVGRSCRDILHGVVCAHVGDCPLTQLLATGSDSITRQYTVSRGNQNTACSMSVYPLRDKAGAIVGGIETFRRTVPTGSSSGRADHGGRPAGGTVRLELPGGVRLLEASQRGVIEEVLRRHHWNRAAACEELGLSRTTLWRKMRKLGIAQPPS